MSKADSAGSKTPDLTLGVAVDSLADGGTLLGHVGDDDVLLARADDRVFAVGAHCTHYHGPLAQGLVVGYTVRCPLASRLLQPGNRRGVARAGAGSHRLLACRTPRRSRVRAGENAGAAAGVA
jgi:hypothetical protein